MVRSYILVYACVLVTLGLFHQYQATNVGKYFPTFDLGSTTNNKYDIRNKRQASTSIAKTKARREFMNQNKSYTSTSSSLSCPNLKPMSWEWNRYSLEHDEEGTNRRTDQKKIKKKSKKRLLIGLFSGYDSYAKMLEITGPINKAYARRYGHDVVVIQGIYLVVDNDQCNPPGRRATFNKLAILEKALKRRDKYDQVLILDTDAMMHDMDFDVTSLLVKDSKMLVAHRVKKVAPKHTWDVNAGVTLWNLHHPRTQSVVRQWERESRKALREDPDTGDQSKLHAVLKSVNVKSIDALKDEFAYGHGTVVRHYIRRRTNKQWKDPNVLETRLKLLEEASNQVCAQFPSVCGDNLDRTNYTSHLVAK